MPVLVKAKNFEAEVLQAALPVLVDFFGERCVPCHLQRPVLLELGEEYAGQLKICMFNTDPEPGESEADYTEQFRVIATYGVMSLPSMLLFTGGTLRRTLVGLHTKEELLAELAAQGLSLTPRDRDEDSPGHSQDGGDDQQGKH